MIPVVVLAVICAVFAVPVTARAAIGVVAAENFYGDVAQQIA